MPSSTSYPLPAAGRKNAGVALDRHLRELGDRAVFSHPLALPLLAAPLLALLQWLAPGAAPDLFLGGLTLSVTFAAVLAGWGLLAEALGDDRAAAFAVFAIYLATSLWYYSRTFYTEPYIWAFAILSIRLLTREEWLTASFLLGATFLLKETSALLIGPLLLYPRWRWTTRRALRVAIFPVIFATLCMLKNLALYGRPLATIRDRLRRQAPLRRLLAALAPACFTIQFAAATNSFSAMWSIGIADRLTRSRSTPSQASVSAR